MDEPASPAPIGSTAAAHAKSPAQRFDPVYANAMVHFYRGELGRIMAWRARLDNTTNWAITVTSSIFTVSFSFSQVPHIIFFFNIAIVWVMLWIEARRYRFYDAFRARVRMLEAHFLVPIVSQNTSLLQGDWQKLVSEDLLLPSFKIGKLEAVARRLKRNYGFIFMIIVVAWLTKIFLHGHPNPDDPTSQIVSLRTFYQALHVGHIPSWIVAAMLIGTLVSVFAMVFYISRKGTAEVSEFASHRKMWRI
jgi:uncharacterized membrane protein